MNTDEFYEHIYRLAFVTRYCNLPRLRNESVAEHSFFVAAIILQLKDEYKFILSSALKAAIAHDIAESDLGDPVHPVRERHPYLDAAYKTAEAVEMSKYPQQVQLGWSTFESVSVEGKVVQLADVLQVQQYAKSEIALGNTNMRPVLIGSKQRENKLRKELKSYER